MCDFLTVFGVDFAPTSDEEWRDALDGLARQAYRELGLDPDADPEAFDDFKYDRMEQAVLDRLQEAVERACHGAPTAGADWADELLPSPLGPSPARGHR